MTHLLGEERAGVVACMAIHNSKEAQVAPRALLVVPLDNDLGSLVLDGLVGGDAVGVVARDDAWPGAALDARRHLMLRQPLVHLIGGERGDDLGADRHGARRPVDLADRNGKGGAVCAGEVALRR